MGGLPVHKKDNKTSINPILPVGNRTRTLPVLVWPEKKCQPGNLLMDMVDPVVEAGEVRLVVVPDLPRISLSINNNYRVSCPGQLNRPSNLGVKSVRDKDIYVLSPVNVCCPVASPVLYVTNTTRQSQKIDVRPSLRSEREIKCVKSASVVGHCVAVPTVLNVPNVAHVQWEVVYKPFSRLSLSLAQIQR